MSNSWKKYGGTTNFEKVNDITVNSLVTNNLTVRYPYIGTFEISGNLIVDKHIRVNKDLYVDGNVYAGTNISVTGNVTVEGNTIQKNNVTMYQKLYFGRDQANYMYGNVSGIGINTTSPRATLDICSNMVAALNVYSNQPVNRNIIARNNAKTGVVVLADISSSTIQFFNDISINDISANITKYDGQIQYTKGGYMNFDVSNSSQFFSRVGISNRTNPLDYPSNVITPVSTETVTIYDTSNGSYLPNAYDVSNLITTGSALSLVSNDNSSNTFMNIVTPSGKGLSVGGGAYPLDKTRSMGTIGLMDGSMNYIPTQTMIPRNFGYIPTVTGINTYAPRQSSYVLDVNGPIHVSNGAIIKSNNYAFEIKNVGVPYRTNTTFTGKFNPFSGGIAIGSPIQYSDTSRNQQILYTTDGGVKWNQSQVDPTTIEDGQTFGALYVYDQSYSIIAGSGGFSYVTDNGGIKWKQLRTSNLTRTYTSVYMIDKNPINSAMVVQPKQPGYWKFGEPPVYNKLPLPDGSMPPPTTVVLAKRIIMGYDASFIWFDMSNSDFNTSGLDTSFNVSTIPINNNGDPIKAIGGYGNYIYVAGTQINKYDITNFSTAQRYIPSPARTYKSISVYDTTHIVALSDNTSTITIYDISSSQFIEQNVASPVDYGGVFVYDTFNAVAVGNYATGTGLGAILYTNDGYKTWNPVPPEMLNSSGNAGQILNSTAVLTSVTMPAIDTLIISTRAATDVSSSNIVTCFVPNLFNRANNNVLDVCGTVHIHGDIHIDASGKIMSNAPQFSLLNDSSINTIDFGNKTTSINIGNPAAGNTYILNNLDVSNNTTMRGDLTINKNLIVNSNLIVNQTVYATDYEGLSNQLSIGKNIAGGNINIGYFANAPGSVGTTITIGGNNDRVIINGNITNKQVNTYDGPLFLINGNSNLSSKSAGISIKDYSYNEAGYMVISEDRNGYVFRATSKAPTDGSNNRVKLNVESLKLPADISNAVMILKQSNSSEAGTDKLGYSDYTMDVGYLDISSILIRNKAGSTSDTQVITTKLEIQNATKVTDGQLWASAGLKVDNSANIDNFTAGSGAVSGLLRVIGTGSLQVDGAMSVFGTTTLNGPSIIGNTTNSSGLGSGALVVQGGTSVAKNMYIGGNTNLSGNLIITNTTDSTSDGTVGALINSGGMYVAKTAYFNGNVNMANSLNVQNNIDVSGNVTIRGTLIQTNSVITGDITYGGNVTITNQKSLTTDGKIIIGNITNATGPGTGALQISSGGASIGGNVWMNPGSGIYTNSINSVGNTLSIGGLSITENIYIGYGTKSTIHIGNGSSNSNTINIGGPNDTVNITGRINAGNVIANYLVNDKTMTLNYGNIIADSSVGSGIQIYDNSRNNAGYMLVSANRQGFNFKAPGSTNIVNFNLANLNYTTADTSPQMMVLSRSAVGGALSDSSFNIGVGRVNIESINGLQTALNNRVIGGNTIGSVGSQSITGNLIISNNLTASKSLLVNSTTLIANTQMNVSGNAIISRLGVATSTVNETSVLDISGQLTQYGGFIWQF
jgi:cytoskeletal protein CcmA (bactofilin family)